jgi:hypothetical protein
MQETPEEAPNKTVLFTQTNVNPPVADITKGTDYFIPNVNGIPIPVSLENKLTLFIDQTNQPSGQAYELAMDVGTNGTWVQIQDSLLASGPIPFLNNINSMVVGMNSINAAGDILGNRPDHMRLHVKSYGGWNLPSLQVQTT